MSMSLICILSILLFVMIHGANIDASETEKLNIFRVDSKRQYFAPVVKKDVNENLDNVCEGCMFVINTFLLFSDDEAILKGFAEILSERCAVALTESRRDKCYYLILSLIPKGGKILYPKLKDSRICYETKLCFSKRARRSSGVVTDQHILMTSDITNKANENGQCAECVDVLKYFRDQLLDKEWFRRDIVKDAEKTLCSVFPEQNRKSVCSKLLLDYIFYHNILFKGIKDNLNDLTARCADANYCGDYTTSTDPYPDFTVGSENRAVKINNYSFLTALMYLYTGYYFIVHKLYDQWNYIPRCLH